MPYIPPTLAIQNIIPPQGRPANYPTILQPTLRVLLAIRNQASQKTFGFKISQKGTWKHEANIERPANLRRLKT